MYFISMYVDFKYQCEIDFELIERFRSFYSMRRDLIMRLDN